MSKKITPTQLAVLRRLAAIKESKASAYTLRCSIPTMEGLERRGMVTAITGPGSFIWPQTSTEWRITDAGRTAAFYIEKDAP